MQQRLEVEVEVEAESGRGKEWKWPSQSKTHRDFVNKFTERMDKTWPERAWLVHHWPMLVSLRIGCEIGCPATGLLTPVPCPPLPPCECCDK